MEPDDRYRSLQEAAWRRPLTDAEGAELSAWLATHPAARPDWAAEAGLSEALRRLPDVSVPSNFTAQVLRRVDSETTTSERFWLWNWHGLSWQRWVPRLAVGALIAAGVLASVHFHQAAHRAKLIRSVVAFSEVTPALPPDSLVDFDSIRKLAPAYGADTELLTLLQ